MIYDCFDNLLMFTFFRNISGTIGQRTACWSASKEEIPTRSVKATSVVVFSDLNIWVTSNQHLRWDRTLPVAIAAYIRPHIVTRVPFALGHDQSATTETVLKPSKIFYKKQKTLLETNFCVIRKKRLIFLYHKSHLTLFSILLFRVCSLSNHSSTVNLLFFLLHIY